MTPNAGGLRQNTFSVRTTKDGRAIAAAVSIRFTMPGMGMPSRTLRLRESTAGGASGTGSTLTMPGIWHLLVTVRPRGGSAFAVEVTDVVNL